MHVVTRALNAEKPSRHHRDLSSTRTSIRQWSRSSARFASKLTLSSRTCVDTSECTLIVVCKLSVTSAVRVLARWLHCRSTSASVTQPDLVQTTRAISNLSSNHSKFHQQWLRHQIRIWCFAIIRHSFHQASRRFPVCREFSHRAQLKHHTFLYYFQSTTSKCHLWMSLTEKHRRSWAWLNRTTTVGNCHRHKVTRRRATWNHHRLAQHHSAFTT